MSEISVISAFFDIGRGSWGEQKDVPHFIPRSTDTYFERFSHLAKLENEMVIYTSEDLVERVKSLRGDKPTTVIPIDFSKQFKQLIDKVASVQNNPEYQNKINPSQIKMPEYWNADYVVVNALKSSFVTNAIRDGYINNDLIAWLDFGYCRTSDTLNNVTNWEYDFDPNKIHLFNLKEWKEGTFIEDVIANNDVYMTGPCIVAGSNMWLTLQYLVGHSTDELIKNNLIDDDQTLLLMSYLLRPDLFELHPVKSDDWFIVFKEYNK